MGKLYSVLLAELIPDNLDAKGLGKSIPFVNAAEGLRGSIKTDTLYAKSRRGMSSVNDCLKGRIDAGELELDLSVKIEIDHEGMSEILHELEEV